jgi:hypothetical protein
MSKEPGRPNQDWQSTGSLTAEQPFPGHSDSGIEMVCSPSLLRGMRHILKWRGAPGSPFPNAPLTVPSTEPNPK